MARTDFHPLRVVDVEQLTEDSAAVRFEIPDRLADDFRFAPGQWMTLRRGAERRSYSICAPVGKAPRIGVRVVPGGLFSGWLVHQVRPGDVIDVQVPAGHFSPDLNAPGRHVLISAGSGITPVLSIAASVLAAHETSTLTLIYGNRRTDSVMFADEVADLKDAFPSRMRLIHVLSREPQEVDLFNGRLDAERLRRLLPATVDIGEVDHFWLCGPFGMITDALDVLTEFGVPADRVHRELFHVGDDPPVPAGHPDPPAGPGAEVTVTLEGRSTVITVPQGVTVLDGAQKVRPDLPFACKGGVCGTCRALLTRGEVHLRRNYALEQAEIAAGYVLTCQALPVSGEVTIDFDS